MQKDQSTRPSGKRELPAHMVAIARKLARATGRHFGEVSDDMVREIADREAAEEVRAYASQNTKNNPEPVEALPPRFPARGPKDQERINERGLTAQRVYLSAGDSRDLSEIVVKHQ